MGRMSITRTSNVNFNWISSQRFLKGQAYSSISQGPQARAVQTELNSDTSKIEDFTASLPMMELPALLVAKQSYIVWYWLTRGLARLGKGVGGKTCCKRVIFLAEGPCREIPECCFQSEKAVHTLRQISGCQNQTESEEGEKTRQWKSSFTCWDSVKCSTV